MWGFANYRKRDLGNKLIEFLKNKTIANDFNKNGKSDKGKDQDFLHAYFWPSAKLDALIHDSYICQKYGGIPFPTKRPNNYCFVPCAYCCDPKYNASWGYECPKECRPKDHQDWIFC